MDSLFNLLPTTNSSLIALLIIAITLCISFVYTFVVSLKLVVSKGYLTTCVITPVIISSIISMVSIFLDQSTSGTVRIVTIAVALGLIRFRSINARAEELLILFGGVAIGLISGLGYVLLAAIVATTVALLFVFLSSVNIFKKRPCSKKTLKITIPEDFNYEEELPPIFQKYLKDYELVSIKTTAMGSLFRLSYKVEPLTKDREKDFINELRTKNSNLEIMFSPYVDDGDTL